MKKISDRFRKTLSAVLRGIGVSVVSLIIQACYGVLPPDLGSVAYGMPEPRFRFQGTVKANKTGKPIKGIQVSIKEDEEDDYYVYTNQEGFFYISITNPAMEEYILKFKDVDGPANDGLFKETTRTFKKTDSDILIPIFMDEDTETGD